MQWNDLKARLLSDGRVNLTGESADRYIARSAAGPGAGGGAVFFAVADRRVKLAVSPESSVRVYHHGSGSADLLFEGERISGRLLEPGFHCPGQAYITVSASCIFSCRYCNVPRIAGRRKTVTEIVAMVESVREHIHSISITSGVQNDVQDEEGYVLDVVRHLSSFGLPIGVSIYPTRQSPYLLWQAGVTEVKFNIEAATEGLFAVMCPGLDYGLMWEVLTRSVSLFGRNRVFSNVIVGLGESDTELEACVRRLTSLGVIPVLRPLNPVAALAGFSRPSAERLKKVFAIHEKALSDGGLDPGLAQTMCTNCTGCDLVPGRDV